jgi:sulfatase maturation enzyme AslB (radical SAM superfamily)
MYLTYNEIKRVHIEHTSKCNLLCPQCARVVDGTVNPNLVLNELKLADYKKIFTSNFANQIDRVYWCGNYGDSIASGSWIECAYWLRYSGVKSMQLYTNGSARTPDWWRGLAKIFNRDYDYVYFSIDGLEDTNHLYRVNSNFKTIMKNAKAFINAGGNARWDYLIFDHNEHQIEETYNLAKEMGFKQIVFKNTSRFVGNNEFLNSISRDDEQVYDKKTQEKTHTISHKNNENKSKFDYVIEKYGNWENYVNATPISCKYQKDKTIYIDFMAKMWPCCWVGAPEHFYGKDNIQIDQLTKLLKQYNTDFNSLRKHTIEEVLNHQWFNNELITSWTNTMQDKNAKLHTCGRTCGTDYEFTSSLNTSNAQKFRLNPYRPSLK